MFPGQLFAVVADSELLRWLLVNHRKVCFARCGEKFGFRKEHATGQVRVSYPETAARQPLPASEAGLACFPPCAALFASISVTGGSRELPRGDFSTYTTKQPVFVIFPPVCLCPCVRYKHSYSRRSCRGLHALTDTWWCLL